MQITPVILSGGSGERLWPLSRREYPKQYLNLTSKNTMLQETILRLSGIENLADPIIICNADHRFLVAEQCKEIKILNPTILLEPVGRNTAPAIAAAATQSIKKGDNPVLLVLSADHIIQDINAFHQTIKAGMDLAEEGKLVTFGVVPSNANTEYGYIKFQNTLHSKSDKHIGAHVVKEFVEKPNLKKAQSYLKQGNYLWNSGMFMFKANTLLKELNHFSPEIVKFINSAVDKASHDLDFIRLDKKAFELSPSDSIDYALMEKSDNVVVVSLSAQWNDIGSWTALYDIGLKDNNGNVIQGDVFSESTSNSYVNANHHMVATIGVKDLVIVDTPNATLISTKEKVHEIKKILEKLQEKRRNEQFYHRKVYRPWGWYDSIEEGEHFQVKRLHVNPGAKLSLQMHHKRAEHWVVIKGTATASNGKQVLTLKEGESTYIPVGTKHSLENQTNAYLEIIEVQSGTYLGEDDIVRFEDIYGRVEG